MRDAKIAQWSSEDGILKTPNERTDFGVVVDSAFAWRQKPFLIKSAEKKQKQKRHMMRCRQDGIHLFGGHCIHCNQMASERWMSRFWGVFLLKRISLRTRSVNIEI